MSAPRISPAELRSHLERTPPPLVVCAYDDPERCASIRIPGALNLIELDARLGTLPRTQEIVFY
jgi:hypothetical protein